MKHIASRQNPLVARYRAVARGDDRARMLLDGWHLVADAAAARCGLEHVAVTAIALERAEVAALLEKFEKTGVEVTTVTAPVMAALSPVRSASPIVALSRRPETTLATLFANAEPVLVAVSDLQDPGNVGAVIRVAEAGGATGAMTAGRSADPFSWKSLRGSMGSALRLPLLGTTDLAGALAEGRRHGCRIVAAVPRGGRAPDEAPLGGKLIVLVGGEGEGLPASLVDAADERVSIPMADPVDSLNAAVCAALLVYEARRQRHAQTAHGLAVSGRS